MITITGHDLPNETITSYFSVLVNQFFKILPLKESGEPSLKEYMRSLQLEMLGCKGLLAELSSDPMYLSLLSVLQYLIENDCDTAVVKREVFKAISICKKLKTRYSGEGV